MDTFNHMKIKSKLSLLVGLFVLGFMAFGIVTYSTMNTLRATLDNLKVNGPKYKEIVQSKDLIADILPPRSISSKLTWWFCRWRMKPIGPD